MKTCVITGASGYIGRNVVRRLLSDRHFDRVVSIDMASISTPIPGEEFVHHDVRVPFPDQLNHLEGSVDWIFHFAAVHREPGHIAREYFETNLPSARNVCRFADRIGCKNIFFTSSIAVYGPTSEATDEQKLLQPTTPYGISKLCSEMAFEAWLADDHNKRLAVVRPGVIYGPEDPGNIGRLIKAIKKGRFAFPGKRGIRKSYGYIEGLVDSIVFILGQELRTVTYNYVDKETLPLGQVTQIIANFLGVPPPRISLPVGALATAAKLAQLTTRGKSSLHPARVRKAATQTWIVPKVLLDLGFDFKYDLRSSLEHWQLQSPRDFL